MSYSWSTRGRHAALGTVLAAVAAVTLLAPSVAFAEKLVSNDGNFVVYTPEAWQLQPEYNDLHPVILYLHGANHKYETQYEPLLEDLASQYYGSYVIFPRYDATNPNQSSYFLFRAMFGSAGALTDVNGLLAQNGYGAIDTTHITIAGHSWGGAYALVLANVFSSAGYVTPDAIVLHDPAGYQAAAFPTGQFPGLLNNLTSIPSDTRLAIVVAWDTFLPEYYELLYDVPGRGYSGFSGIWTSAWRNTNVTPYYKDAVLAWGSHQGMLSADYPYTGATYREVTLHAASGIPYGGFDWFFDAHLPQ